MSYARNAPNNSEESTPDNSESYSLRDKSYPIDSVNSFRDGLGYQIQENAGSLQVIFSMTENR